MNRGMLKKMLEDHTKWLCGIGDNRINLTHADLRNANLRGADLKDANLTYANLDDCIISYPLVCPEVGSFVGWKKAKGLIVKLEICEDALRSSSTTNKCRCSKAKVLAIETLDGKSGPNEIASSRDENFIYRVGEIVEVKDFNTNRWEECSTGIHFFITRDEAVRYW